MGVRNSHEIYGGLIMKNNAKEHERTKTLTEARRIFTDAENYSEAEIFAYANLTSAILGIATFDEIKDNDIIISKLKDSIDHTLTPLEASTLVLRYGLEDGMYKSRDTVGRKLGYTYHRIQQLEAKALRKMRHPLRVTTYSVSKRDSQLEAEQRRNEARALLSWDANIQKLDLSVRSYNCLMRAGITTIEQLLNTSDEDLLAVRNLGKKGYEELIACKKAFSSK